MLLCEVPRDVLFTICSFLNHVSLCRVAQVCRQLNNLSSKDSLWMHRFKADGVTDDIPPNIIVPTWKRLYQRSIELDYRFTYEGRHLIMETHRTLRYPSRLNGWWSSGVRTPHQWTRNKQVLSRNDTYVLILFSISTRLSIMISHVGITDTTWLP